VIAQEPPPAGPDALAICFEMVDPKLGNVIQSPAWGIRKSGAAGAPTESAIGADEPLVIGTEAAVVTWPPTLMR
jgi:hypothetical protein